VCCSCVLRCVLFLCVVLVLAGRQVAAAQADTRGRLFGCVLGFKTMYCWRGGVLQGVHSCQCRHECCNLVGVAHGAFDNELDALAGVRELLSFLPLSNRDKLPQASRPGALLVVTYLQCTV
jgi:hypothetical protein